MEKRQPKQWNKFLVITNGIQSGVLWAKAPLGLKSVSKCQVLVRDFLEKISQIILVKRLVRDFL